MPHKHTLSIRFIFSIGLLSFAFCCRSGAGISDTEIAQRLLRAEGFLTNVFDQKLQLLPEYSGSSTYWLFHDNYLAAHLLKRTRPDLTRRIRSTLSQFGVTNSGKIEILFGEATQPLPFRTYLLTNVAAVGGKTIRTELVTTNILSNWKEYADLRLLASLAQAHSARTDALTNFSQAVAMWDGTGFCDAAVKHNGIYYTYKLALYLIAAAELKATTPHRDEVLARLISTQAPDGGFRTDYKRIELVGVSNVETTCLAMLALNTLLKN